MLYNTAKSMTRIVVAASVIIIVGVVLIGGLSFGGSGYLAAGVASRFVVIEYKMDNAFAIRAVDSSQQQKSPEIITSEAERNGEGV